MKKGSGHSKKNGKAEDGQCCSLHSFVYSGVYGYDAASQRTTLIDPDGGVRTYTYDLDSRLETYTDPQNRKATYQYDAGGRETTIILGSGTRRRTTYDAASQVVSIIDQTSTNIMRARYTFSYDQVGNRESVRDNLGQISTYAYDAKNRLTQDATVGLNTHTYDYSYDTTDNRLTSNETGTNATWTYDLAGRMVTSLEGSVLTTYTFGDNGNLQEVAPAGADATTMTYDKENRMVSHKEGTTLSSMTYDGDGFKRSEISSTGRTTLIWDGSNYLGAKS